MERIHFRPHNNVLMLTSFDVGGTERQMVELVRRLDPARFLKLHRSCIVNLDFVEAMTPDENSQLVAKMTDGTLITCNREVSRRLREQSI